MALALCVDALGDIGGLQLIKHTLVLPDKCSTRGEHPGHARDKYLPQ